MVLQKRGDAERGELEYKVRYRELGLAAPSMGDEWISAAQLDRAVGGKDLLRYFRNLNQAKETKKAQLKAQRAREKEKAKAKEAARKEREKRQKQERELKKKAREAAKAAAAAAAAAGERLLEAQRTFEPIQTDATQDPGDRGHALVGRRVMRMPGAGGPVCKGKIVFYDEKGTQGPKGVYHLNFKDGTALALNFMQLTQGGVVALAEQ